MIIDLHEKYDMDPQWFGEQARRDAKKAWEYHLCELLAVYRVHDQTGAEDAAGKMTAAGISEELIMTAME